MHPSRPSLLGFPSVACKGPEATPLTSHASLFWLPPLADSQTRCPPRDLATLWVAILPEAFTLLPSLGDDRPGRLDFQKPSLSHHWWARSTGRQKPSLSCLIGQARSTGLWSSLASETSVSRVADSFGGLRPRSLWLPGWDSCWEWRHLATFPVCHHTLPVRTTEETDHNPHSRNRASGTEVTLTDQWHTREKSCGVTVACLVDSDFTSLCRLVKLCFSLEAGWVELTEPLKAKSLRQHLVVDLTSSRTENTLFRASWKRPCVPQGVRTRAPEDVEVPEA